MPQNYFITGKPKAGKTTLLKDLTEQLKKNGLKVGGFVSPEERHHGTRTAFQVMDVETGKKAQLANINGDGPKVSKYHVDVKSFELVAVPSMEKFDTYDVFVIDEIGVMEMKSSRFAKLLDKIIESDTPLIASLHEQYVDSFANTGEVIDLDSESRQEVYQNLLDKTGSLKKRSAVPKTEKPAAKKEVVVQKKTVKQPAKVAKAPPKKAEKMKQAPKEIEKPVETKVEQKEEMEKPEEKPKEKGGFFHKIKKWLGG